MPIQNSNISLAFGQKKRTRTQNYRGSVIATTINLTAAQGAVNADGIALMPIPYTASVKSIKIGAGAALGNADITLGVWGINRDYSPNMDGTFPASAFKVFDRTADEGGASATFGNTILRPAGAIVGANANGNWVELLSPIKTSDTIANMLCWTNAGGYTVPLQSFSDYKEDRYGMLGMQVAAAALGQAAYVEVTYVDGSPSTSPVIGKTV